MPNEVSLLSSGMKRALSKFNSTYIKWERIPVMLGRHTMLMSLIRCMCRCFNKQQQYCTAPAAFQDCLHMARALMCRGPSAAALLLSSLLTLTVRSPAGYQNVFCPNGIFCTKLSVDSFYCSASEICFSFQNTKYLYYI